MMISKHSVVVGEPGSGLCILLGISPGCVKATEKKEFFRCCILFDGVFQSLYGFAILPIAHGYCRADHLLGASEVAHDVANVVRHDFPGHKFTINNGKEFSFVTGQDNPCPEIRSCEFVSDKVANHFRQTLVHKLKQKG